MFSNAYETVRNFTRPVIVSTRTFDGTVEGGCATFIIVNRDGWIVTAAHVLMAMQASGIHVQEKANYEAAVNAVRSDATLSAKQRHRKLEQIKPNPKWITNQAYWWSQNGVLSSQFFVDPQADIAIGRLNGLDCSQITSFPVFHRPDEDPAFGSSLCRLGFPFATIKTTFDEAANHFHNENIPPLFPNDGIHTRMAISLDPNTNRPIKFIETSTPGLRGQSGGPLFDILGRVWGIQSHTNHLELGFTPRVAKDNALVPVKEHQFMHVGMCTHVQHVIELFKQHGVQYESATTHTLED